MSVIKHIYFNNELGLRADKEENLSALLQRLLYNYYQEQDKKAMSPQDNSILLSQQMEAKLSEAKAIEEQIVAIDNTNEEKRLLELKLFDEQELKTIQRKERATIKMNIINEFELSGKKGRDEFDIFIKEKYPQHVELF